MSAFCSSSMRLASASSSHTFLNLMREERSQSGTVFLNSEEDILSKRNGGSCAISNRRYFGGGGMMFVLVVVIVVCWVGCRIANVKKHFNFFSGTGKNDEIVNFFSGTGKNDEIVNFFSGTH